MGKTIDERIVQLEFENQSFQRGTEDTMRNISELKDALDFTGVGRGLQELDASASRVNLSTISEGVTALKDRFSVMGIVAMTVIQDITNRVIELGQTLLNTLVLDPVKLGFSEYETQINAIQTILANTSRAGTTLEDVSGALALLNTYADQTIYNFTEMTRNIGTFTAAGIDLDTSVEAIKGIANLAAVSGSNSQQASTAMYQLSQALSTGVVKLQDWNSVVNAGMGGQIFQDSLMETARVHGIAIDDLIEKNGSFRNSLQEGWLTKDILTETLAKFTGDLTRAELVAMGYAEDQVDAILELGTMANDAATKVKTITQLGETLTEAMQSGWTKSWELLIGDFDEAKELLTEVSDVMGGIIGQSADARNELLQGWRDFGGRESIIAALWNAFDSLQSILGDVKEAFHEVFPPITAETLALFSANLASFTERIKIAVTSTDAIKRVFKGFFALLDIGRMAAEALLDPLFTFFRSLTPMGEDLGSLVLNFSDYIIGLRDSIKENNIFAVALSNIGNKVRPVLNKISAFVNGVRDRIKEMGSIDLSGVTNFVESLGDKFEPLKAIWAVFRSLIGFIGKIIAKVAPLALSLASTMGRGISAFLDALSSGLDNFDPANLFNTLNSGLFGALLLAIRGFVTEGTGLFSGIADVLDGVGDVLGAWQRDLQSKVLIRIAIAIGILAIALVAMASVDGDRLAVALGGMTVMLLELFGAMAAFGQVSGNIGKTLSMSAGLVGIALALLILAGAVKMLGTLDAQSLTRGTLALAAILVMLRSAAEALSRTSAKAISGAAAVLVLAVALNIIALAVLAFGSMKTETLTQGLIAIGVVLAELAIFLNLVGGARGIIRAATGIFILSGALLILTGVIKLMGMIPADQLEQGLLGMGIALAVIATSMTLMPKNMIATSLGLIGVSIALLMIANAIQNLGGMSWEELTIGLVALGGALLIIAVGLYAMAGSLAGAAALFVAAAALAMLAGPLKALGQMSLEEIGLSLLAIAGVFVVLGLAALILGPLTPALLGLSIALAIFGVAALTVGVGILALSAGLAALAVSGAAGISVLMLALTSIISLIPFIVQALAEALVILVVTIAQNAPILLVALVQLLLLFIEAVIVVIPPLIEAIFVLITALLGALAENLPAIIQAGYDILIAFMQGFRDNIGEIVTLGADIIIEFMNAIGEKLPEVINAGFDMLVAFIDGLADAVEENIPRLMTSMADLGEAIIDGVIQGVTETTGGAVAAIIELAGAIIAAFKAALGIESPSKEFFSATGFIIDGVLKSLARFGPRAIDAAGKFGQEFVSRFDQVTEGLVNAIASDIEMAPVVRPVMDLTDFTEGATRMQNLLADTDISVSSKMARAISGSLSDVHGTTDRSSSGSASEADSSPVQYIQNNYSPKALSRIDIYRQTRNQLRSVKGAVVSK